MRVSTDPDIAAAPEFGVDTMAISQGCVTDGIRPAGKVCLHLVTCCHVASWRRQYRLDVASRCKHICIATSSSNQWRLLSVCGESACAVSDLNMMQHRGHTSARVYRALTALLPSVPVLFRSWSRYLADLTVVTSSYLHILPRPLMTFDLSDCT